MHTSGHVRPVHGHDSLHPPGGDARCLLPTTSLEALGIERGPARPPMASPVRGGVRPQVSCRRSRFARRDLASDGIRSAEVAVALTETEARGLGQPGRGALRRATAGRGPPRSR